MEFIFLIIFFFTVTFLVKKYMPKMDILINERSNYGELIQLPSPYKIVKDILIKNEKGNTIKINNIVICNKGIYLVISKKIKGKIFGEENLKFWNLKIINKNYKFYNPIWEALEQLKALKYLLGESYSKAIYPIVVFSDQTLIMGVVSKVPVLYESELISFLNDNCYPIVYDDFQIKEIYNKILYSNITDKDARRNHEDNIKSKNFFD